VVGQTIVVADQDRDSRRQKTNLLLNVGNSRRINFGLCGINLKTSLHKYPTCVVTAVMDLETCLRSAERNDISTLRKLMPIGG
jgi:hypothetical protein